MSCLIRQILMRLAIGGLSMGSLLASSSSLSAGDPALDLFAERIMPIFRSPKPSSCVQCHLASVDLKDYILPSHEQTFVALRDDGLIDLDNPDKSKILTLIGMGIRDPDKQAKLIHQKTREAELAAFAAWIKACVADKRLRSLPALAGGKEKKENHVGPTKSDRMVRHARKDRLLDSFTRNIWSQRMRCFPCHTPHELDPSNPKHAKPIERHRELEEKYGQLINIFRETPAETMRALMTNSRRRSKRKLPLLNIDSPAESLLVLKPTHKLPKKRPDGSFERPSSKIPITHVGGLKMFVNDQSYKSFLAWIEDYGRTVREQYTSDEQLPLDNWHPTKVVLRLNEMPENLPVLTPVQLFVHAPGRTPFTWQVRPIAFTQGVITPRRFVNGTLFRLSLPEASGKKPPKMVPGTYLIKVYVDQTGRLKKDPTAMLTDDDFFGEAKLDARWREGFPRAEVLSARLLHK